MDPAMLSPSQRRFLARQLRNRKRYLIFSVVGVIAGLGYAVYAVVARQFEGRSFVLIVLLLLQARANLKQHKDAELLAVLSEAVDNGD